MLTTDTSRNLEQNVITDVNANIPSPTPAKQKVLSPEAALLFDKSIVARPLMTPEVCSVHVKNTEYRYRWVNRHSQAGRIYQQRLSQGFVNATKDDVDVLGGDAVATSAEITAGDVILMKIRADLYDAAIKANMQQAYTLARTRGVYLEGASSDVNSDEAVTKKSVAQEPFARAGAAKPFIPANADAIVDDSISSGRDEGARKTISDIRENIKAGKPARS